jgi:2-polyprenyl-6-methoxyphenol hydroxylase-like FAD-dependent oxidoreductase
MATHAVVIGGSLAGLCAGRVLTDYFDRVTVVERDAYPDGIADRAGVPQGRQYHYLMQRGRREYEALFPGFEAILRSHGAPEREVGVNQAVLAATGWSPPRREFRLPSVQASRPLIEGTVRELFRRLPRVEILERTEATALLARKGAVPRCAGVEVRSRDGGGISRIAADLVVDASGATSRANAWLDALGLAVPEETIVDARWGYSSRWYRVKQGAEWPREWWWKLGVSLMAAPPDHMTIVILVQYESGRWSFSMAGLSANYPPHDDQGLAAMIPKMRSPVIGRMLALMEPTSAFHTSRATRNRWRHYERWRGRLDGFLAIGDAAAAYNPTAGQGMSVVAMTAQALRRCLAQCGPASPELAPRFFAAQAASQRDPWRLAVGNDLRLPATEGARPWSMTMLNWYRDCLAMAASDAIIRERMEDVMQLVRPVAALYAPSVVLRVARARIARMLRRGHESAIPAMPPPMPE